MKIQTDNLIIRNFKIEDSNDVFEYLSNPEIYEFEPGRPVDFDECQKIVLERSKGDVFFAIELRDANKVIGNLYFDKTGPEEFGTWELGFILNPAFHRKGYGSEAALALVKHAFSRMGAHRVISHCNPVNTASWKLLEKIGMRREGHNIKNIFFNKSIDDEPVWVDTYEYAVLWSDKI